MITLLYYWKSNSKNQNFGDLLSKYIVSKLSNKKIIYTNPTNRWVRKLGIKHYLAIGSILNKATKKSIIWGSGIISKKQRIRGGKFLAVRGPETRKRLLELGFNCPEIYGDPGLLSSLFYKKELKKKYEIGIIPHYVDYDKISKNYEQNDAVLVINLMCENVEQVFDKIKMCKFIFSTSLHGVIVPHSFNIPALWVKYSDKLAGDNIKFYDYYKSVNIDFPEKILESKTYDLQELLELKNNNLQVILPKKENIEQLQRDLINGSPFNTVKQKEKFLKLVTPKEDD